jgi:hypothetical protein
MLVYQRVFSTNFAWVKSMKSSVCWRFCNPHFASGKRLHFAVENMGDLWLVYRNMVDLSSSQSVNFTELMRTSQRLRCFFFSGGLNLQMIFQVVGCNWGLDWNMVVSLGSPPSLLPPWLSTIGNLGHRSSVFWVSRGHTWWHQESG